MKYLSGLFIITFFVQASDAHAYIHATTGSMLTQISMAGFAGFGVLAHYMYRRITERRDGGAQGE